MLFLLLLPSCFLYRHKLNGTNDDFKHVTVPLLFICCLFLLLLRYDFFFQTLCISVCICAYYKVRCNYFAHFQCIYICIHCFCCCCYSWFVPLTLYHIRTYVVVFHVGFEGYAAVHLIFHQCSECASISIALRYTYNR